MQEPFTWWAPDRWQSANGLSPRHVFCNVHLNEQRFRTHCSRHKNSLSVCWFFFLLIYVDALFLKGGKSAQLAVRDSLGDHPWLPGTEGVAIPVTMVTSTLVPYRHRAAQNSPLSPLKLGPFGRPMSVWSSPSRYMFRNWLFRSIKTPRLLSFRSFAFRLIWILCLAFSVRAVVPSKICRA